MIRVLRIIARLNIGGPAIHATLLTSRLDPERYATTLVTGSEDPAEGNYLSLHGLSDEGVVHVPSLGREIRGLQDLGSMVALVRVIRQVRPHVVHTHAAKAGTLGRLAAWLCGVPIVVHTYHGHVLRGYFSPLKERLFRAIERGLGGLTHELVAVTPTVRQELLDMGIGRPERFSVVPLGLDLERFAASDVTRGTLRRELGVGADVPLIGIVARLVPIKAHEIFLHAAVLVRRQRPDAQFVIVGDGELRRALEQQAGDTDLASVCHFLGWRADLDRIYADLDLVALTSRNEGSPVALIEAMASGTPVVATEVGGVPDVVRHGTTGWLVRPDDPAALAARMLQVLTDERRQEVAAAARAHVLERYEAARLVSDVDNLYQRLLTARGVPSR